MTTGQDPPENPQGMGIREVCIGSRVPGPCGQPPGVVREVRRGFVVGQQSPPSPPPPPPPPQRTHPAFMAHPPPPLLPQCTHPGFAATNV